MKIIKIALFTICALSAYAPEALGGVLLDLVKTNKIEEVQEYIEEQGNGEVNQANKYEETPLYWACYRNNLEIVKLLLKNGAKESVNKAGEYEETPLYWACYRNNLEIVKLLLKNGAKESVNKAGVYGDTPLYLACYNNNPGIVKLLLENGADVTVGDSGKKAIERICSSEWTTENRKKLLMSLLSVPEKGAENETEEQKNSRLFKELVVSSLAENMQQSSTVAPRVSSNDGLRKYTGIANPEQVINQIETVVKFYLFTPFATVAKKSAHLWPVVIGSNSTMGIEKLVFRLSLRQLKAEFGITHEHLMFLRNLQKSAQAYVKTGGKIVIPAKTMRKLCDLWFKFEYNNQ